MDHGLFIACGWIFTGLFNGPAADRIQKCALEEVVVANTLPVRKEVSLKTKKIRQISVLIPTGVKFSMISLQ